MVDFNASIINKLFVMEKEVLKNYKGRAVIVSTDWNYYNPAFILYNLDNDVYTRYRWSNGYIVAECVNTPHDYCRN